MARYSRSISSETSVSSASSQRQRNWRNSCDEQEAKLENLGTRCRCPLIFRSVYYFSFQSVVVDKSVSHKKCKHLKNIYTILQSSFWGSSGWKRVSFSHSSSFVPLCSLIACATAGVNLSSISWGRSHLRMPFLFCV